MTSTQDSGVTSPGSLPDGNSDIHFSLLKTQSLKTTLQITHTVVAFSEEIFFFFLPIASTNKKYLPL